MEREKNKRPRDKQRGRATKGGPFERRRVAVVVVVVAVVVVEKERRGWWYREGTVSPPSGHIWTGEGGFEVLE